MKIEIFPIFECYECLRDFSLAVIGMFVNTEFISKLAFVSSSFTGSVISVSMKYEFYTYDVVSSAVGSFHWSKWPVGFCIKFSRPYSFYEFQKTSLLDVEAPGRKLKVLPIIDVVITKMNQEDFTAHTTETLHTDTSIDTRLS